VTALAIVLLLVALQRIGELIYAERNTRALRRCGAIEHGAAHYPLIVLLHLAWLVSIGVFVPWHTAPSLPLLGLFIVLQGLRVWVVASLGPHWTTRVIVLDGAPLVRRGPYRWLRHPNYAVVAGEIALLPLMFGAWRIAAIFSVLNGAMLWWRIRVEDRALGRAPRLSGEWQPRSR